MRKIRVLVATLALALVSTVASASTFLQFSQLVFNNPFIISNPAVGVTQINANTSINVIFDSSFCLVAGCGGVTNGTFNLVLNATNTSLATTNGTDISQNFAGTIAITQGLVNLLTVNFSDILTGGANGSTPTLASSQPPDVFNGSSTVLDPLKLGIPRGFSISFSDWTTLGGGGLARTVGPIFTIASATADGTGTFNAEPQTVIPEPATLLLLGAGLLGAARRIRKA